MTIHSCIGKVVLSRAGRDAGKFFIIIGVCDENHVYISDGRLRTFERPKKKKLKHLIFTKDEAENIRCLLQHDGTITNSMIKSFLQSYGKNKEV